MIGDASEMVVTRRSSRMRAFREAAPAFARRVWVHNAVHSCSNVLLGLSALVAIFVVAAVVLCGARPAWWRAGEPGAGGESRSERARRVDNNSWWVVSQVRPMVVERAGGGGAVQSEPWSVSLSAESATAWLNEKLPAWLRAQESGVRIPSDAEMCAAFERGVARLGIRLTDDAGSERYVSLAIQPRVDEKGLWLPAPSVSLGRLAVPLGAVMGEKGDVLSTAVPRELAAVLRGEAPAVSDLVMKLPDGRKVRLLRFEIVDERLVLTMRTEAGANGQSSNGQIAK